VSAGSLTVSLLRHRARIRARMRGSLAWWPRAIVNLRRRWSCIAGRREKAVSHIAFLTPRGFCKRALQDARRASVDRECQNPLFYKAFWPHARRAGRGWGPGSRAVPLCPRRRVTGIGLGGQNRPPPRHRPAHRPSQKKPVKSGLFESRQNASRVVHFATRVCKKPHTSKTPYGTTLFHAVPTCMLHARGLGSRLSVR
jgi:hypothetical protein